MFLFIYVTMKAGLILVVIMLASSLISRAQDIILMDRFDGNNVVNDSVITLFSSDTSIVDLTRYFVMVNNTDRTLALFLRKTVHTMADSTTDYFCFGPKCWPDTDTTDLADSLQPGVEDYSFASHVVHFRRFDMLPLPPGFTSITYTVFDNTTFAEPVEASVTVNYHLSALDIREHERSAASVFPNPAKDWLTVRFNDPVKGNGDLRICNSAGETVVKKQVLIHEGYANIAVGELHPGLYYGSLLPEDGPAASFKFLVSD